MRVAVSPDRLEISPGIPQVLAITITNTETIIGGFALRFLGVDPGWVSVDDADVALFPDESRTIVAQVTVPAGLLAGERTMAVQVREQTPPHVIDVAEVVLVVPEARNVTVRVDPVAVSAGRTGRFSLLVDNTGNTVLDARMAADDAESKLRYRFDPPRVELAPGQHRIVEMTARGRRALLGAPLIRQISVHLVEGDAVPVPVAPTTPPVPAAVPDTSAAGRLARRHARGRRPDPATAPPDPEAMPAAYATFIQKALVSRGPIALLGLLVAVTVFAVVISVALGKISGQSQQDRDLALKITADQQAGTAPVGVSSVSGTVRMLTSADQGAGSVTVSVYAADAPVTPIATDVTAKDGTWSVGHLPAGDYKVFFRGAGFVPVWYPTALDAADADTVKVQDNNSVVGLDVALGGVPASISGTVVGDDVSDATVTLRTPSAITPVTGGGGTVTSTGSTGSGASSTGTSTTGTDGATVLAVPVGAGGVFTLGDVPSPSVYDLVVTKQGYAPAVQRIDVAAGEDRGDVLVNLRRGDGLIAGSVVDGSTGRGLGNVELTATAGQTKVSTVSISAKDPAGGDKGSFLLRDLPTPATYTIVASVDGYASQTLTATLAAGQALQGLSFSLGASAGTLTGRAVLADAVTQGIGGVTVKVSDGATTVETATLSRGTAAEIGTWSAGGLAVPGTYTVTLSGPGLSPATTSVTIDQLGALTSGSTSAAGVVTPMRSSTAVFSGTVQQAARLATDPEADPAQTKPALVGEITVQLTSGASTYSVVTASVPDGSGGGVGEFYLAGVPPGTYTVNVSRAGVTPTTEIVTLTAGRPVERNYILAPPARIAGTVKDGNGPVGDGYVVELYRASDYPDTPYLTTSTNGAGTYEFSDVDAPENYVVQVRRTRGGAPLGTRSFTLEASENQKADVKVQSVE